MDDINLGLYPRPQLCLLGLTTDCSGVRVFTVELLWTVFLTAVATSLPTPAPASHPPTPSIRWPKIGAHLQKNGLKWPKIKQVTNSKL